MQMIAGGGSGIIAKTTTAPLDRAKILLQIQGMQAKERTTIPKYRGVFGTLKTVVAEEGFLALWKGNAANVMRVIPVSALKFSLNDEFKALVRYNNKNGGPLTTVDLLLSGTLAGMFQQLVTYPLDVIRTRLAINGERFGRSMVQCLVRLVQTEGIKGLYKGLGTTMLTGAPYVGIQMTCYDRLKKAFASEDKKLALHSQLFAGALAGIIAQTITFPGDVIRRRQQIDGSNGSARVYSNVRDIIKKMYQQEGIRSFYKGLGANIVRSIPDVAIQFAVYDALKKLFQV